MAELIKERWLPSGTSGLPRRDRSGCDYVAFVPDLLTERNFVLHGDTAADVADAEREVGRLQGEARSLMSSEAIARLLLRAEAVSSSRIEGLEIGGRRLLEAQAVRGINAEVTDVTALEVMNNIEAMSVALGTAKLAGAITVDHVLDIHRTLMRGTRLEHVGGVIRETQNWIGGSHHNPCSAAFVPPPPDRVEALLQDLCAFCSRDDLPAVAQAAVVHAQFETIHPFADGNGRTGRALIHVVLGRRGLVDTVLVPVSLVLATWARDYVDGLTATRHHGPPDDPGAIDGVNRWIALFASATTRAVGDAFSYEQRVREVQDDWRRAVGRVRSDSAVRLLIEALPGAPMLTVQGAATLIRRSVQATNQAIDKLQRCGVLKQTTIGRRNRAFEAPAIIAAFTALERRLASPDADTRTSSPARPVPYRPPTQAS